MLKFDDGYMITDAYQAAVAVANKEVPIYEIGTPEHDRWLKIFDKAFAMAMAILKEK